MTIRNDITIDWDASPRVITVAAPATEVTIQDLHDTLRSMEAQSEAIDEPSIIMSAGKEALGGGVYVGLTTTLLNALLAFEARSGPEYIQCNVSGGNLVALQSDLETYFTTPISPTAFTQIVVTASSSATISEQAAIQFSSFNGGVTLDVMAPPQSLDYPTGTPQQPVNNLADAMTIAISRGFTVIYIIGDAVIDTGGDYHEMTFIGASKTKSTINISEPSNVENCEFYDAHVTGTLDGDATLKDCLLSDLNYITGYIEQCVLSAGTILLGNGSEAHFLDCWSGISEGNPPIINMGGTGQSLALRNYNGEIKIINKTGPETVNIDLNSGHLILDSSITAGEIVVRGVGTLINNTTGTATVDAVGLTPAGIPPEVTDSLTSIDSMVRRCLGQLGENEYIDQQQYINFNGQQLLISARKRIWDTKANAQLRGAQGLLGTYTITGEWEPGTNKNTGYEEVFEG